MAAADTPLLLLNAPLVASRLGYPDLSGLDLLELFAFVHPARFCVPTPKGLAHALGLAEPEGDGDVPSLLQAAAGELLAQCEHGEWREREGAWSALQSLARLRWPWAQVLAPHIAKPERAEKWLFSRLPDWEETPERPQPGQVLIDELEIEGRLERLTGEGAERREGQHQFSRHAGGVFAPRDREKRPHVLLAQAGTGIGKTLGYLAPASLWAERSGGTVWVSTYTKNLQRQLRQESTRAWPATRPDGSPPVVVRKGRENYLCLLNLEDALQGGFAGRAAVLAQMVARWAAYSRDGDMIGGDLPGWLGTLFRKRGIAALTDQRGECVYAGCPHYRKCFIERAARASAQADLVIANHALVMVNAARGRDHAQRPTRIVFDEGHHVFDAADSTFSAALTGAETIELRRWLVGPERASRGRRRGLAARLADIASYDEAGGEAIEAVLQAAQALPSDGWLGRIGEGLADGPIEALLAQVRTLTYARDESGGSEAGYGIETEAAQLPGEMVEAAGHAGQALAAIRVPLIRLAGRLEAVMEDAPDWLDAPGRARIEGARHSLAWRVDLLAAWEALLGRLGGPGDPEFVDWLAVERGDAREYDVGLRRHWLDPMKPFARVVLEPAHGVMLTSATLTDRDDSGPDWPGAIARSGRTASRARAQDRRCGQPVRLRAPRRGADRHRYPQGRRARARGRLCAADRGLGRRRTRPVHRDPPDARSGEPHRRPARAHRLAALCAACRSYRHRHPHRHFPRRSARQPDGHRCTARRGRRAGPIAAPGGDGKRAVAPPDNPPPRTPRCIRRGARRRAALRRPHHPAPASRRPSAA